VGKFITVVGYPFPLSNRNQIRPDTGQQCIVTCQILSATEAPLGLSWCSAARVLRLGENLSQNSGLISRVLLIFG